VPFSSFISPSLGFAPPCPSIAGESWLTPSSRMGPEYECPLRIKLV
jgi:hypothetical protein